MTVDSIDSFAFGVLFLLPLENCLKKQGSGNILDISSLGGRLTGPTMALYHASKFAVEGLSEILAHELKPFGIKVAIIEPGGFATDFSSRSPNTIFLERKLASFARAIFRALRVVESPDPPVRLAIGPGGLPRPIEKLSSDIEEYKRFEDIWRASPATL